MFSPNRRLCQAHFPDFPVLRQPREPPKRRCCSAVSSPAANKVNRPLRTKRPGSSIKSSARLRYPPVLVSGSLSALATSSPVCHTLPVVRTPPALTKKSRFRSGSCVLSSLISNLASSSFRPIQPASGAAENLSTSLFCRVLTDESGFSYRRMFIYDCHDLISITWRKGLQRLRDGKTTETLAPSCSPAVAV